MDSIEEFMNHLSDLDWGWYPFLFLRPPKNTKMGFIVLAKIALVFGSISGLIIFLFNLAARRHTFDLGDLLMWVSVGIIFFFIVYALTFAHCWNRRAERLQKVRKPSL